MNRASARAAWVVTAWAAMACTERGDPPGPKPSASVAPSVATRAAAPVIDGGARPNEMALSRVPTRACRALTVKGKVVDANGTVMESGSPLDGVAWLEVAAGGSVVVKHAVSGRELTFFGPATLIPCKNGDERFVLIRGRATTTNWAGARPGAEVLIATPFALLRYGDATLDVAVEEARLAVKSTRGEAWLEFGKDGSSDRKVAAGAHDALRGPPEAPTLSVANCDRAATTAEERARDVLSSKPSTVPLGERAAVHVRARRTATAACAVAEAVAGRWPQGPERDGFEKTVLRAEARYRSLPSLAPHTGDSEKPQ